MISFLSVIHIIVCVFLVLVVLLQSGKGADLAGAFGGGGSQTALGARGAATLLGKLTTIAAIAFMLTSLALSILKSRGEGSSGIKDLPAAESVREAEEEPGYEPPAGGEVKEESQRAVPRPDKNSGAASQPEGKEPASTGSGD